GAVVKRRGMEEYYWNLSVRLGRLSGLAAPPLALAFRPRWHTARRLGSDHNRVDAHARHERGNGHVPQLGETSTGGDRPRRAPPGEDPALLTGPKLTYG